jgi:Flp pilus assembly pilin Flp
MTIHPHSPGGAERKKRRGATALEYLFCITLIFVVCIAVIQHLGAILNASFTNSSNQIQKNNPK